MWGRTKPTNGRLFCRTSMVAEVTQISYNYPSQNNEYRYKYLFISIATRFKDIHILEYDIKRQSDKFIAIEHARMKSSYDRPFNIVQENNLDSAVFLSNRIETSVISSFGHLRQIDCYTSLKNEFKKWTLKQIISSQEHCDICEMYANRRPQNFMF